jgi:hypothetical protein
LRFQSIGEARIALAEFLMELKIAADQGQLDDEDRAGDYRVVVAED